MHYRLILGGLGIAITAVGTVTANAQQPTYGPSYGPLHGMLGLGTLQGPMRQQSGYAEQMGLFTHHLHTVGGPGPMSTGHLASPAVHPLANVVLLMEQREAVTPQPLAAGGAAAAGGGESDQAGAASAQPNPAASPSSPRPPAPPARAGRCRGGRARGCQDRDGRYVRAGER